ncbi:hypothetical protein Tco_0697350, partial [Tanacetum coccineum]
EDEEIEKSLDSDSISEDAEDEGPITEDEDPGAGDEGLDVWDEGPGIRVESRSLKDESHGLDDESRGLDEEGHSIKSDGLSLGEEEEVVPKGKGSRSAPEPERPERVSASRQPTLTTWTDPEDGMVYIDVPTYPPPAPPGGLICDHAVRLEELSPALFERYDRDIGELFTRSGAVRDEIFSQRYRFRSLEHKQERVAVTFGVLWRPVLTLESWAGQTDAQRADLWHAISDTQRENRELRLQLAEERRVRLELAEIVDNMRRGQEPRGDV